MIAWRCIVDDAWRTSNARAAYSAAKTRDHGNPDHALARGDEALRAVGLRVDLVCPQRVPAVRAHDRGVNLEDVTKTERALRGVLVVTQLVDGRVSPLQRDRLAEVPGNRGGKASADSLRSTVRPDERPVRAPDLHGDEVGLPSQLRLQLQREMRRDVQPVRAHELRSQHPVDVLGQARPRIVERLPLDCSGQQPAQDDRSDEENAGARHQEDTQKRDRAVKRPATGDP